MKEVIQEILDEEKQAREQIENARSQARRATEAAQVEAQKVVEDARRTALQEAEQIFSTAKAESAREQSDQINTAREKQNAVLNNYQNEIANAVELLFQALPTGEKASP